MKNNRYFDTAFGLIFGAVVANSFGLLFTLLFGLGVIIVWALQDSYKKTRGKK